MQVVARPWQEHHWSGALNFAHEHYRPGYYAARLKREQEADALLQPLYKRPGILLLAGRPMRSTWRTSSPVSGSPP